MKATEQYFPLVLFVMRYKLVLNMKSELVEKLMFLWNANETLKCNHSNGICGVALLFVFSRSEEINFRLTNELNCT